MSLGLLGFQEEDVQKLKSKRARLIGNDPGTGKTYEGIALDLLNRSGDGNAKVDHDQYEFKKTLIVCPKNALDVWDEHLMDLTDHDIYLYTYQTRHKFMQQIMHPKRDGYFIVNYDSLRIKDLDALKKLEFYHIIGDEIHRIKNRKAQLTRSFKQLKAVYKTGMSGTPADNKPEDLWSILNWLWPNYYTAYNRFVKTYTKSIQIGGDDDPDAKPNSRPTGFTKIVGLNHDTIPLLHEEMRPWFTRRRKEDVLPDLPDKYYSRLWVDLGAKQRLQYDQMKKIMMSWVEEHADQIDAGNPIIAQAVVVQLIRLQQMSAGYLVPRIDPETGEQAFHWRWPKRDPWTDVLLKFQALKDYKKEWAHNPEAGYAVKVLEWDLADPSAKLDALMELLKDRADESVVVFSQSKAVINLLGSRLHDQGIPFGLYTGDTKQADRDQLVRDFQAGRVRVFAGTIKAGGEAITLTRSSTVVFIDRWWSPSKNSQAEDRTHRIGQTNAVEVIDIMARNTVDLGRYQAIEKKAEWLGQLLGDVVDTKKLIKELDLNATLDPGEEEE